MDRTLIAGLDIGGTKIDGVCVDPAGNVVAQVRLPTESTDQRAVLASAEAAVEKLAEAVGSAARTFGGIGVGIPGQVDAVNGAVAHAVNLRIDGSPLPIGPHLAALYGVGVVVENDVNAAAIGAQSVLGLNDLAYLSIGTGVAAGLVLDGKLRRGRLGVAGEIGHLPVDPAGPLCPCGQRGCLEMVASGPAIARRWGSAAAAVAASGELGSALAHAVAMLALVVDPAVIVVGGGVAEIGEPLLKAIVAGIEQYEATSPFLAALGLAHRVVLAPRNPPVGAIGAALLASPVHPPTDTVA